MGDIIYNTYDVINRVFSMTYKKWCVVSKSGCDVICIAYGIIDIETLMTYIHFFSKHWYIVCNVKNTLSVMSGIVAGKAHNGFVVITLCLMPYQVNIT